MNNDIVKVLTGFCTAMCVWETACFATDQLEDRWSGVEETCYELDLLLEMQEEWLCGIFKKFCIDHSKPTRGATFGSPPEYDPAHFDVTEIDIVKDSATAIVRQATLLSKGQEVVVDGYELVHYFLKRVGNVWKLEDRRRHTDLQGRVLQAWNSL
ncbi:MAG TPA: hypothetical protein DEP84_32535 [Chloroflexi bacterium]|nr:hypothetical protein [Chloroflexota bacterium]